MERIWLDERSWVDIVRGWLPDPDSLYLELVDGSPWRQARLFRYERYVDEPRLTAPARLDAPGTPDAIRAAQRHLQHTYDVRFDGPSLAWYRDGRDSVAFHRDRDLRWLEDTVIAIASLGVRRPFHLRPRSQRYGHEAPHRGATHDLAPGPGDLIVMGGACQAGWEHAVPKVPGLRAGRVSVQWRWTARTGRPEVGPSYRAPRHFSHRS